MNKKIIKYKIILLIMASLFLFCFIVMNYINISNIIKYKKGDIIKVQANIEESNYYEYGLIKRKYPYLVYSFIYDDKKITISNMLSDNTFTNKKLITIYYDKINNREVMLPSIKNFILSFMFFVLSIIIIVYAINLKRIYT
ncbi:hypothetical protein R4M03_03620 [Brachyspira pilosicoli]|uniref:DUF3592 domain-containing protein n=1 Tax=Brachyspira pilosicoli P43/6/78 TaxID=1042417 RepID=A0A3B6VXC7_BRAPL|nr:hypothetical protein [Brachyspira pilosicoli]AGA65957.1 hypothetical protein BPP43_03285 [Brachyspira pilosicoli P43/6/78]